VPPDKPFPHVCLAGRKVTSDWFLIRKLELHHAVTLIEGVDRLAGNALLRTAGVLVLDCTGCGELARQVMPVLKAQFPELCVVVVEGTYLQQQVAGLFRDGIRDYFPAPYDAELLTERVASLCGRPARAENGAT
jgi:hypothetical protein